MSLIDLPTAKSYLQLGSTTAMDSLIQILINGAESWIAAQCGLSFGEKQFDEFYTGGKKGMRMLHGPVRKIISCGNRDTPGSPQLENTDYFAWNNSLEKYGGTYGPFWALPSAGALYGAWTGRLPVIMSRWMEGRGRWEVSYSGGWQLPGNPDDGFPHYAPDPAVQIAILELVKRKYANRGGLRSESVSGYSVNWVDMADSDIMEMLGPYLMRDV